MWCQVTAGRYTAVQTSQHRPPGAMCVLLFVIHSYPPPSDPNTHAHIQSLHINKDFPLLPSQAQVLSAHLSIEWKMCSQSINRNALEATGAPGALAEISASQRAFWKGKV